MSKIAVVYWSGTGNTESMAELIIEGIKSESIDVDVYTADEFSCDKANEYDVFAFGCPSMGVEELEESEFEPMFSSVKSHLKGKKVALFGSYGWGDGEWMRNWEQDCIDNGCDIISDCVIVNEAPDEKSSEDCKDLGKKLAKVVKELAEA
ncbi:flavodoxin [Terrisporobacter sp.]|uniref:flavodoxin n=1 Tax=Terrisporobacter sp. TaxID=1965305 RepID=UPI0026307D5C|nr:flavodoxin [Terrisporobacter sp.]